MATILNFFMQNNYGLVPQNFTNHNSIIDSDGKLLLGYQNSYSGTSVDRITIGTDNVTNETSTPNYFGSRDLGSLALVGPTIHLFNLPKWANPKYIAITGESSDLGNNAYIQTGEDGEDGSITWGEIDDIFTDDFVYEYMVSCAASNFSLFAFCSDSADYDLIVAEYNLIDSVFDDEKAEQSYYYYPIMASYATDVGTAGVVCAIGDETLTTISDFAFCIYDGVVGSFGTPTELGLDWDEDDFVENVDMAYDPKNGVIGILSSRWDNSEDSLVIELSTSDDEGATFSTEEVTLGGTADFEGSISGVAESHVSIVSGVEGGFIIGYTRLNGSGVARPYIHIVTKNVSGGTYTIGEAKECGQATSKWPATTSMIGPLFFKAPAEMDVNIDPAELVYIAYQMDEGIQIWADYPQGSCKSLGIIVERLDEVALASSDSSYTDQDSDAGEIVTDINILESPYQSQDYYANGWTGQYTNIYAKAFGLHGTTIQIKQYEPRDDVYIAGRSSYGSPTTHLVKAFFEPSSWAAATQGLNATDFADYIDRDLRKVFLPPNFYMPVTYNDSYSFVQLGTVYLAYFDGYIYQLKEVVPRFFKDQIIYWEANCYNVYNFDVWSSGGGL
jgi:hypothetical protein